MRKLLLASMLVSLPAAMAGCDDGLMPRGDAALPPDSSMGDAGSTDGGMPRMDAGPLTDAGPTDAGMPDAGPGDGGPADGGPGDGGMPDAGPTECGEPGCGWCASRDRCLPPAETCAFEGRVGSTLCWDRFEACDAATCWDPDLAVGCADQRLPEDFSSGRYNVHAYAATLPPGEAITFELTRTAGTLEPALFLRADDGTLLYGGDPVTLRSDVQILMAESGRGGSYASVTLQTSRAVRVSVLVTGWSVVDSGFSSFLGTAAAYELRVHQACEGSASESVGRTNAGTLENGVRINHGPGYVVADTGRDAYYGTQETVDLVRAGMAHVVAMHPGAEIVQVRDVSVLGGGEPSGYWPHASHESGRDVDMTYHLRAGCSPSLGCPLADVPIADFDAEATWTLFRYWLDLGVVTYIFVDTALQEQLYRVAEARGATSAELSRWIQWPRAVGTTSAPIRHVNNHRNHHHVRFTCPVDDSRCVE